MPLNMAPASVVAAQATVDAAQDRPQTNDGGGRSDARCMAGRRAGDWMPASLTMCAGWRQGAQEWRTAGAVGGGEAQQLDWRHAGEEMLASVPGGAADVAAWVTGAYQAAVAQLIAGG